MTLIIDLLKTGTHRWILVSLRKKPGTCKLPQGLIRNPGAHFDLWFDQPEVKIFGWMKNMGNLKKTHYRITQPEAWVFSLTAAAENLVGIRNLAAEVSP
jgi:hypothetical protein